MTPILSPVCLSLSLSTFQWFCPFNQRVWIALEAKGVPYQLKEVNPYKKEPEFLKLNPKGLVPTVGYKGTPLYESIVLLEFLDEIHPEKPIFPTDPVEKAKARIVIDQIVKKVRRQILDSLHCFSSDLFSSASFSRSCHPPSN